MLLLSPVTAVLYQQLGFFMASDYVSKRRLSRLGYRDNLGNTFNCWIKLSYFLQRKQDYPAVSNVFLP